MIMVMQWFTMYMMLMEKQCYLINVSNKHLNMIPKYLNPGAYDSKEIAPITSKKGRALLPTQSLDASSPKSWLQT